MTWTLARARDQLSEVIRQAADSGPRAISIRGQEAAFVVSKRDLEHMRDPAATKTLKAPFTQLNLKGVDLERDQTVARVLET